MQGKAINFNFIDDLGRKILRQFHYTSDILLMFCLSMRAGRVYRNQTDGVITQVILTQVYFTGVQALPLITTLAAAASSIVILQSSSQFNLFGGGTMVGQLMVMLIVREVAPLLTALIVIARSGTAVASELGNMRVNREIDALEVSGINPLSFIVFPRIVGGMISVLCLTLYFTYVAFISGFLFAKIFLNLNLSYYIDAITHVLSETDVILLLCKNIVGGAMIFTICCYQGMQVKDGPHEVPQATTAGVMNSIIYVVGFNILVSIIFYINQLIQMGIL